MWSAILPYLLSDSGVAASTIFTNVFSGKRNLTCLNKKTHFAFLAKFLRDEIVK